MSGFVEVKPQADFSYGGGASTAATASDGSTASGPGGLPRRLRRLDLAVGAQGARRRHRQAVWLPFARLHADPVLQVGPIPVVVNLDLTCYFRSAATAASPSTNVAQDLKGDFKAGGTFGTAACCTPVNELPHQLSDPYVRHDRRKREAALGAQATVGLDGAVGVTADLAPYLRGEAAGTVTATTPAGSGTKSDVAASGSGPRRRPRSERHPPDPAGHLRHPRHPARHPPGHTASGVEARRRQEVGPGDAARAAP